MDKPVTTEDRTAVAAARARLLATCPKEDSKRCGLRRFGWSEEVDTEIKCMACNRAERLI